MHAGCAKLLDGRIERNDLFTFSVKRFICIIVSAAAGCRRCADIKAK